MPAGKEKGGKPQQRLGSCVLDGVRYFLIQGARLPKHRFDEAINELGLHVGGQAVWRITQSEIDKKVRLSPSDLYDALSHVSGTKLFNQRREDAIKQVESCKQALVEVRDKLGRLQIEVAEHRALVTESERKDELAVELSETIPAKKASLEFKLATAEAQFHNGKLTAARDVLSSAVATQVENEAAVQAETRRLAAEEDGSSAEPMPDAARSAREQRAIAAGAAEEARTALVESEAKLRGCKAFKASLPTLAASILRLTTVDCPDLKVKCAALRLASQHAEERFQAATNYGDGEGLRAMLHDAAGEARDELKRSREARTARTKDLSEAQSSHTTAIAEKLLLEQAQAPLLAQRDALAAAISTRCSGAGCAELASGLAEDIEGAATDHKIRERDTRAEATALAAKCAQLESELRCWMPVPGEGAPGNYLFEAVNCIARDDDTARSLNIILEPSLTVRIVTNTDEGLAFGKCAKAAGRAGRIWPLDRIDCPRGALASRRRAITAKVLNGAASRGGVMDPLALVEFDNKNPALSAAIIKAVGTWVVTEDDAIAASVLSAGGLKAVTLSGNQHTPGRLVGGGAKKSNKLRVAAELKKARADFAAANESVKVISHRLSLLRLAADDAWALRQLIPQLSRQTANLEAAGAEESHLASEVATATAHLELAASKVGECEARAQHAESAVEQSGAAAISSLKASAEGSMAELLATEEELSAAEEEVARLSEGLRPPTADVEDFLVTCASKEEVAPAGGLFSDIQTTIAACDQAVAAADVEVTAAQQELERASLAKDQASAAVTAAVNASDVLRLAKHEARISLQHRTQLVASGKRTIKGLEAEVTAHSNAAVKAAAKASELHCFEFDEECGDDDDAVLDSASAIKSAMHDLAAVESAHRAELKTLRRRSTARIAGPANRGELQAKMKAVSTLEEQLGSVVGAIGFLEQGMDDAVGLMKTSNRRCFEIVRRSFRAQVAQLLPGKEGDLKPVGSELESGICLGVQSCGAGGEGDSTGDLSGGQKSLVGLALTFSLSSCRRLPLYVLDEVDAPLDEQNQALAANAIALAFAGSQVLCVSHHAPFHRRADSIVQISRQNESSKLLRCVKQQQATVAKRSDYSSALAAAQTGDSGPCEEGQPRKRWAK